MTHYVAHLDILGFSEIIQKAQHNNSVISLFDNLNTAIGKFLDSDDLGFEAKIFSDNMCITKKRTESKNDLIQFFVSIASIQLYLITEHRFFVRGGITYGEHYHSPNTIVSPAYIEAYNLETKLAKYPRIMLHPKVVKDYKTAIETPVGNDIPVGFYNSLIIDSMDGTCWLNYFMLPILNIPTSGAKPDILIDLLKHSIDLIAAHKIALEQHFEEFVPDVASLKHLAIAQKLYWLIHQHNNACNKYIEIVSYASGLLTPELSTLLLSRFNFGALKIDRIESWRLT